ncbi:hypothetical protein [Sphingomonas mesophila]|uniref:hypothetical protein n=1 Tax=Sphingomonas mesophila TaxID=2303576 RepID=UPI0013C34D49|nr:hypothetical protein [Sphingomonas mesophila]
MRWKLLSVIGALVIAGGAILAQKSGLGDKLSRSQLGPIAALSLRLGAGPAEDPSNPPPRVGTNLDPLAYWSTATPFLDLMKSSSRWIAQPPHQWDSGEPLDLDEHGWVRSLPTKGPLTHRAAGLAVLRDAGSAAPPRARYVILYEGEGTIGGMEGQGTRTLSSDRKRGRVVVQAADKGALHLVITSTDPNRTGNYIRNIRIVREDRLALLERGEIFNPDFLRVITPFSTFRFMDWMMTNSLYRADGIALKWRTPGGFDVASPLPLDWANRPEMSDSHWDRGVPAEAMVELANRTGANPWFNMPINASDDYVRNFAQLVRARLRLGALIRVELSNEVWNWAFVQSKYAEARAKDKWGPRGHWMEWYGQRAAEVGSIWNRTFGEPATGNGGRNRVRIVYNTQQMYKGLETPGLLTPNWKGRDGKAIRAADYFDDYAITGYYGAGISEPANVGRVMGWWGEPDGGYASALRAIRKDIEARAKPLYLYHAQRAKEYGLDLVTYESGYGERTPDSQASNQAYTDFMIAVQRRPEIYAIELANYRAFQVAGGKLFMNFGIVGKPSRWGSWSALEAIDQPSSPRYRALLQMIALSGAKPVTRERPPAREPLLKPVAKS